MQEYKFLIDRKATIWVRESHFITADNQEQADEMMKARDL